MAGVSELPLLHKYVIRPQDDLQLVLTKLNYRLCVKQVSQVIHRRSLGASISEAVDLCEIIPILPPRSASTSASMSNAELISNREMEPLVFSDDPQCVSSPKLLSPADSSYCGTMKSDDSGIVMDDSHNFSMTSSDHERDAELNFTSAEASPLEEENGFIEDTERDVSASPVSVDESPVKVLEKKEDEAHVDTVEEFFRETAAKVEDEYLSKEDTEIQMNGFDDSAIECAESDEHLSGSDELYQQESFTHFSQTIEESSQPDNVQDDISQSDTVTDNADEISQSETVTESCPDNDADQLAATQDPGTPSANQEKETNPASTNLEDVQVEDLLEIVTVENKEENQPDLPEEPVEQPETDEDERVDFVKEEEPEEVNLEPGIRCNDAYAALDILKTKYRLSNTSAKKFVITFSSWNVNQISYPMSRHNRCSWWEDGAPEPGEEADTDDPHVDELMEKIYSRQGEISDLVDKIMEEEAAKIRAQQQKDILEAASKPSDTNNKPDITITDTSEDIIPLPTEDIITPSGAVPNSQSAPPKDSQPVEPLSPEEKKKNRNALQRFIRAMRKRMRRNRPPSDANRTTA